MPEETVPNPQIPTTSKTNLTKIFAAIGLILILAIVVIAGLRIYLGLNTTSSDDNSPIVDKTATASATSGWKTYTAANGVSFKYPTNWTVKEITQASDNYPNKYTTVTSPTGLVVYFVQGIVAGGGACTADAPEMIDANVLNIKDTSLKDSTSTDLTLVEWGLSGGLLDKVSSGFVRKEVLLNASVSFPKLGDNGKECLTAADTIENQLSFSSKESTNFNGSPDTGASFYARYPNDSSYQKLSIKDYFDLPDIKTAEKILTSLTI